MAAGFVNINISMDVEKISAQLRLAAQDLQDQATVRALNRTIVSVRKQAIVNIRKVYLVQAKTIRARLHMLRARRGKAEVTLEAIDRPIPLSALGPKWRQRQPVGATIQITRGGGRVSIPGAFVAQTKRGVKGVFRRLTHARMPLVFLTSEAVPDASMPALFLNHQVLAANVQVAQARFPVAYEQEARYQLLKHGLA